MILWISSILLAVCGIPQAFKTWKEGHARGMSMIMLQAWLWGEVGLLYAFSDKYGIDWAMVTNYGLNICSILFILRYKIFPRESA